MDSRTQEELGNRQAQLENMRSVIADVGQKTKELQTANAELAKHKDELSKKVVIKSGKLEFILDEKEVLFEELQKVMEKNRKLKNQMKKRDDAHRQANPGFFGRIAKNSKIQKGLGWFSSVKGYFKKKELDTIAVSGGKVKKNIKDGKPMNIGEQLENSHSFFASQTDEDILEMKKQLQADRRRKGKSKEELEQEDNEEMQTGKGTQDKKDNDVIDSEQQGEKADIQENEDLKLLMDEDETEGRVDSKTNLSQQIEKNVQTQAKSQGAQSLLEKMKMMGEDVGEDDSEEEEEDQDSDEEGQMLILQQMRMKIDQIHDEDESED